jgi:hypothetical protein
MTTRARAEKPAAKRPRKPRRNYEQDWKKLAEAQANELSDFITLLRDLVSPDFSKGRCIGALYLRKSSWRNGLSQNQGSPDADRV